MPRSDGVVSEKTYLRKLSFRENNIANSFRPFYRTLRQAVAFHTR
jgi:hypothetical protein